MGWIDNKIAEYYQWLKDNTAIREDKGTGWFAVSTPFVGLFNDNIEIYVKKESESTFLLSDDGETIENLFLSGVDVMRSPKRKEYMQKVANNFGIQITAEGEITAVSNGADFARRKHDLISAISTISDMIMLANENVTSVFAEDVVSYIESLDVISTPSFLVKGRSGLDFSFDIQIPGKKTELVIKPFNTLRQDSIERFLFCMEDIRDIRQETSGKELKSLVIVNDKSTEPPKRLVSALEEYGTQVLLWSRKDEETSKSLFQVA